MTRLKDCNAIQDIVELLAHDGIDNLGEAIRRIMNEAMRLERQRHLGVGPYESSELVALSRQKIRLIYCLGVAVLLSECLAGLGQEQVAGFK